MSCYKPMLADKAIGDDGKIKMINFRLSSEENRRFLSDETVEIPCGKCLGCKLQASQEWAQRIMNEVRYSSNCWFVTLTYDDDHLQFEEDSWMPTLVKNEVSVFNKRLRSALHYRGYNSEFRFYLCGEYGSLHERPHYHVIYFNLHLPDLFLFKVENGQKYYVSDFLSSVWKKGFVLVANVTYESAAYVARYTLKKQNDLMNDASHYYNRVEPFTNMSRRSGIGKEYYNNCSDEIYRTDSVLLKLKDKITKLKPAKYYDRLFDVEDPDRMAEIKAVRQARAAQTIRDKLAQSNLTLDELRDHELELKKDQISRLRRDLD